MSLITSACIGQSKYSNMEIFGFQIIFAQFYVASILYKTNQIKENIGGEIGPINLAYACYLGNYASPFY